MNYIVYNKNKKILRKVICSSSHSLLQAKDNEFVIEGIANDVTQKVEFDGLDDNQQPINPRIVNKTPEEIEADNPTPPEIPFEQKPAHITNQQWQEIQDRIRLLENKI